MDRKGHTLMGEVVAAIVAVVVVLPVAKWLLATGEGNANVQTRLEMQTIIQDYWARLSSVSYDSFEEIIREKGSKWTLENVGGKYDLSVEFSKDSKYKNALCSVGETPGAGDRHCRRATITLVSKHDPPLTESRQATRVAPSDWKLADMESRIAVQEEQFKDYFTKTEADARYACPWDYHLVGGKCVACPDPSNWKEYRSGNCTLSTCPTGQKANAAKTGCDAITCHGRTTLVGDVCQACPLSEKQYYTAASGCATATCPTGQKANAAGNGCEAITCPSGQTLQGDTCVYVTRKSCRAIEWGGYARNPAECDYWDRHCGGCAEWKWKDDVDDVGCRIVPDSAAGCGGS